MSQPDAVAAPHGKRAPDGALDVVAALRHATAARHAVLDAAMPLASGAPSLRDYADHLRILRAWLVPIEAALAGFHDGPQDTARLPRVERVGLIDADLGDARAMGAADGSASLAADAPAHRAAFLRAIPPQPAYRWGLCYVVEGSQLGGVVLYRRLADTLAPHPLRYLSGDGHPPGPRWQAFLRAMREDVRADADIALACQGACDAFDAIIAMVKPRDGA